MNAQEFFEKTVLHCMRQAEPSKLTRGNKWLCAYAGENGNACAIGVHLSRELAEAADGLGRDTDIRSVLESRLGSVIAGVFGDVEVELLEDCQQVHDSEDGRDAAALESMWRDFRDIAAEHGLTMPEDPR